MSEHVFLALDYGAESGRGILVTLADGKASLEEIHRFPNRPVRMGRTLHWDWPFLVAEMKHCLSLCAERGVTPAAIGVDTWGVDFGLLTADGTLLGNPVHYRDSRTEGIATKAEKIMPIARLFEHTALQFMPINTLFQLHAMQLADSPLLKLADTLLMVPDLLNHELTGLKRCELSEAHTGQFVGLDRQWSQPVLDAFDLPADILPDLIEPGTVLGELAGAVCDETRLPSVPVAAVAAHDTGAAVAAIPAEGDNWAYLSCGTWSIMGAMVDAPIATPECYASGFGHEATYGGWYLCRNILGLWLIQELKRKWDTQEDPWDYVRMTSAAADASDGALLNVADDSLLAPPDMEEALLGLISQAGQPKPESRGQLVRCVLESLALEYNLRLEMVAELQGKKPDALYMVGGGIHNKLLCQLTANACNLPVYAGADQCTSMGNALGQALALGVLDSRQEIRQVMRESFEVTLYEPADQGKWDDKRSKYMDVSG